MKPQTVQTDYSSPLYLNKLDAYWRAANYLSVGQIYLKDNPLLRRPLEDEDVKIHPIGHWGTVPGQNFIYAHLNRVIQKYDLNMFYIEGPGHGGQVMVSNAYLDGSYTEIYPEVTQDERGMQRLFKQFSFPGGVASHAAPETPGSIHEGGELGYSLSHGIGTILDNPDLIAAVVIGDGEAETGPLAASWFSNRFINPISDGAVLPIVHVNGFKISNPTMFGRQSDEELEHYFRGLGWEPIFIEGDDPAVMHTKMAETLDSAVERIKDIQRHARDNNDPSRPMWPVLIFRTPKGWTGPEKWDGQTIEGSFRAHQVPIPADRHHMQYTPALTEWMNSYRPQELFDEQGRLKPEISDILPKGERRMAMNPVTNAGKIVKDLKLPELADYAVKIDKPGAQDDQDMHVLGEYVRDVMKLNEENRNFRIFGPDETMSNRLSPVFEVTKRQWVAKIDEVNDEYMAHYGRVIDSQLSEHQAEGMLEGYVLSGRHGFFASYEAFLRVVDSMITQHFKWMRKASDQAWRADIPSLNLISSSTVFQQDHNGYTHQDPGILTHLADKKAEFIREYLPADANTLLAVFGKIMNDRQRINLVISSKHPRPQWFSMEEAAELVEQGVKIVDWASTAKNGEEPDIVIASSGTEPTVEALAAIQILHQQLPELKIRCVNAVDLLRLRHHKRDPRGLTDEAFNAIFTMDKPIVYAFHGYEGLLKDLFFDHANRNLHVHGYRENGDITTPFDMRVLNEMDRFSIVKTAVRSLPNSERYAEIVREMDAMLGKHTHYVRTEGTDLPEVADWRWEGLK
ncbi:phosphoketolase family protein [Saccharibacillus kuerlensis]|uniref:Probable phosphoketolase n=1 Tax=Saccharibacillus kuerlensis TaxID=459527 RepID=A0ABQ2KVL4_9BACL|nr:phosphoketolase family protein [Saccharibacillus kuerlensis]GGN94681.1 putative phosphoketolase [Saccharibacillus kuerlensis]